MLINVANIKAILGISVSTYDAQIALLLPQVLGSLSDYCRNDFVAKGNYEYVYDNANLVFTTTTITHDTDISFVVGDFIRIYNSEYNNGLYQIKSIDGLELTIETSKTCRPETIASGYIALIQFPDSFLQLVAKYINQSTISNPDNVKNEQIDDLEITYFGSSDIKGFMDQNSSSLNEHRLLYKRGLPGVGGCVC